MDVLRMTLNMSLYVMPGDETLATQSTVITILPSRMTLHVPTVIWFLYGNTFNVSF